MKGSGAGYIKNNASDRSSETDQEDRAMMEVLLSAEPATDVLDIQLVSLTILAGIVTLIGLFLNNVAIVIGAMVISPLIVPIYAVTIFAVMGEYRKALNNLYVLVVLLILVIVTSALTTFVFDRIYDLSMTPEIMARMSNHEILILMAVALGIALVISHTRGFPTMLIGIGISIAIIPPVVVTGITIVMYQQGMLSAILLMANNILGLVAGSFIALLLLGIQPKWYRRKEHAKKMLLRILVLLVFLLAGVTVVTVIVSHNLL